ncbi:hypothetical protein EV182_000097 [Spiromyces aspiralis]|uniref:Uncharacterized protein n=1 Tax=Spiromyces aspiralis TaxID=68401 RepID=A0ACC1HVL1_9FUNG|nr:hypothetical protein EV182_000097 [Spiromyces aspiralis]
MNIDALLVKSGAAPPIPSSFSQSTASSSDGETAGISVMSEPVSFHNIDQKVYSWRQKLLFFLDTTIWGRVWEIVDLAIGLAFCSIYIVNTTIVEGATRRPKPIPWPLHAAEFGIAVVFITQFAMRYMLLAGRWFAVESIMAVIAGITPIVGFLWSLTSPSVHNSYMSAGVMAVFYPARFYRLRYAVGRVVASGVIDALSLSVLRRQAVTLTADVVIAFLTAASFVHSGLHWYQTSHETSTVKFSFFDAFYFVTVGSLDDNKNGVPQNTYSQLIRLIVVAFIAIFIPQRASQIIELVLQTSRYAKKSHLVPRSKHVILCGQLTVSSVRTFLAEFFNPDHGTSVWESTVVILHHQEPTAELKELLHNPAYENRVSFVRGSPANFGDLERAHAGSAVSIFFLARKLNYSQVREDDAEGVTVALALNAFNMYHHAGATARQHPQQEPPRRPENYLVYIQALLPESVEHIEYLQATKAMCIDEYRMGLIAKSLAVPGFAALIYMLSTTVTDKAAKAMYRIYLQQKSSPAGGSDTEWVLDYLNGVRQEIYQMLVPTSLVGRSFFKAARYFYRTHHVLAIAVGAYTVRRRKRLFSPNGIQTCDEPFYDTLLAPRNYRLQENDIIFAIAPDDANIRMATRRASRAHIKGSASNTYDVHVQQRSPVSDTYMRFAQRLAGSLAQDDIRRRGPANTNTEAAVAAAAATTALSAGNEKDKGIGGDYISDSSLASSRRASSTAGLGRPRHSAAASYVKQSVGRRIERVARKFDRIPSGLRDHVLICDASPRFPRNLPLLIQSLKYAFRDESLSVVVLSPAMLDKARERLLRDFANVYIIRGTPLSQPDLRRARLQTCRRAIVLSNNKYYNAGTDADHQADSTTLLVNLNVRAIRGNKCFVVSEIVESANIHYLDQSQFTSTFIMQRSFMAGNVFLPSMLDSMLCRSFTCSHLMSIIKVLMFNTTAGCSGSTARSGGEDINEHSTEVATADLMPQTTRTGQVSLISIPWYLASHTYASFALILMKKYDAIPLGIYRTNRDYYNGRRHEFPFVMCNPRPSTLLQVGDAVYIVGPPHIRWDRLNSELSDAGDDASAEEQVSVESETAATSGGSDDIKNAFATRKAGGDGGKGLDMSASVDLRLQTAIDIPPTDDYIASATAYGDAG